MEYKKAWKELSILVDGVVVKSVVIASFRDGIVAYWPPNISEEVIHLCNKIYLPNKRPGYLLIEYLGSAYKYIVIALNEKILVLQVNGKAEGEYLGKKLLEVFSDIYSQLFPGKHKLVQVEV